ncbi:MAG: AAA family ATPase [Myxococcaceae bacterium]|nr:AAA family ATPase [Myxococcaceae bacterium]
MKSGVPFAGRFRIEKAAGAGGMAEVFKARDERTGRFVALKLATGAPDNHKRLEVEAATLRTLDHPAIPGFVDAGSEGGQSWLAMQWVEGESLADRVERAPLNVAETLTVATRLAAALGHAHARGFVHRDIKPANVVLPGGRADQAVLIDFGIARGAQNTTLTQADMIVGTFGYMSPEQVRGERPLDARTDVFALGCLVYRCLTGRMPFDGDDLRAVLARILLDELTPLRDLAPLAPVELEDLVARMLSKDAAARPANGHAVEEALRLIPPDAPANAAQRITGAEQHLVTLVLCAVDGHLDARALVADDDVAPTAPLAPRAKEASDLHFGGAVDRFADGSRLVVFSGAQAEHALACANALHARFPRSRTVVVSGRAQTHGARPIGDAIRRALRMLDALPAGAAPVTLDAATSAALAPAAGNRPFVGRDAELDLLRATARRVFAERSPRPVLVSGEAAIGKSRLARELVSALEAEHPRLDVFEAKGDPMTSGASLDALRQLLEGVDPPTDLGPGSVGSDARAPRSRIDGGASLVGASRRIQPTDPYLRELLRLPQREPLVATAKQLAEGVRSAWAAWVVARCKAGPVVLLLDDLQWLDEATVAAVDAALRSARGLPLLVVATARPEVRTRFPQLWARHGLVEVGLTALSPEASAALVRAEAEGRVGDDVVARLVERGGGSPFLLQELVRAARDGHDAAPASALAVLELRLSSLAPHARRLLRAGSVFGETFDAAGVEALLGAAEHATTLALLPELVDADWLVEQSNGRYTFRHSLVREASYAMLVPEDLALAHRLALDWLEAQGTPDAAVLAAHAERAGQPERAARHWVTAAGQALHAGNLRAVAESCSAGLTRTTAPAVRAELQSLDAEARIYAGDVLGAFALARDAVAHLDPSTPRWLASMGVLAMCSHQLWHGDTARSVARALLDRKLFDQPPSAPAAMAASELLLPLDFAREHALLETIARGLEGWARTTSDPSTLGHVHRGLATEAVRRGDLSAWRDELERAARAFDEAHDVAHACLMWSFVGYTLVELGAYEEAIEDLRYVIELAAQGGHTESVLLAKLKLGWALAQRGAVDEAAALEDECIEAYAAAGNPGLEAQARLYRAELHRRRGELDSARVQGEAALGLAPTPVLEPPVLALLARVYIDRGDLAGALALTDRALAKVSSPVAAWEHEVLLVKGLALRGDEATAVFRRARAGLEARAALISNPADRARWRTQVPENARILALTAT